MTAASTPGSGGSCVACGNQIRPSARFCDHCGHARGADPVSQEATTSPPSRTAISRAPLAPRHRRRRAQLLVVAAIGVAVIVTGAIIGSGHSGSGRATSADGTAASSAGPTTDKAGHFVAVFPATPALSRVPISIGKVHLITNVATVGAPYPTSVVEVDLRPPLPQSAVEPNLHAVLGGYALSSGATLTLETATTFQGHRARQGEYAIGGDNLTALAFTDAANDRLYVLIAPPGGAFDSLIGGFAMVG
jgi:hypothetical protein